jgi:hypothetical protein
VLNILFSGSIKYKNKQKTEIFGSTPDETMILKLLWDGLTSGEEMIAKLQKDDKTFDVSRFNIAITTLEIRGVVKREYGNQWILA